MKPIFVSFYTNNGYEKEAERLIASLEKFNLDNEVVEFCNPDNDWRKATAHKPRFILDMLIKHERPVVWTDADSEITENPILFDNLDCNVAFHKRMGREVLSGTVYFDHSIKSCGVLTKWSKYANEELDTWEQIHLGRAVRDTNGLAVTYLPVEYCTIFDGKDRPSDPVIVHWQASRRLKKVY